MQIFVYLALLIAVIAVILALQNTATVTVVFLFWQINGSLALVLLLAIVIGVLITLLAAAPAFIRGKWSLRSLRKKTAELESSLNEHKLRLEEAQRKLEAQSAPLQPAEPGSALPDQPKPAA